MKKTTLLLGLAFIGMMVSCGEDTSLISSSSQVIPSGSSISQPSKEGDKTLVAYFSATGNTGRIAGEIQNYVSSDSFSITPSVPYTADDLNYSNSDCRANQENNDPSSRPEINNRLDNPTSYQNIYLGYPIWWGKAPKIIYTFLETYDFEGKTIIPFCTSASSPISGSEADLHALEPSATWIDGRRFSSGESVSSIHSWVDSLDL